MKFVLQDIIFVDVFTVYHTLSKGAGEGRSWMSHCATSQHVAGSIPYRVIRNFHGTMALGSNRSLTEMSTRNISCGVNVAGV